MGANEADRGRLARAPARDATAPQGPGLRPPAVPPHQQPVAPRRHLAVWIALGAVLGLASAVVWLLPRLVSAPGEAPQRVVVASPPPEPLAESSSGTEGARGRAEQELQGFLRASARLELLNVAAWGGLDWGQAADEVSAGDRWFAQRRFAEAADAYARGHQVLQRLEQGRPGRFAEALRVAEQALKENQVEQALQAFELALAIEPGDAEAQIGLQRARTREAVLQWMQRARQAEADGDLEAALAAYQEVSRMDSAYPGADAGRERTAQALDDGKFKSAMSGALAALAADDLTQAREHLHQAAQLRPEDPSLQDARRRLQQAGKQARLSRSRQAAAVARRAEDWSAAIGAYEQALIVEPNAGFARHGLQFARSRKDLHDQLDRYLVDPQRLYSAAPRSNAERVLAATAESPQDEPRLASKLAELRVLVQQARSPIPVVLHSDGQTEVAIYHVGRLGRFQELRVELHPGTYTAVGSRTGYRDVRRVFTIRPGEIVSPLAIRCEEQI